MKIFDKNKINKIKDRQLRYSIVYYVLFILMALLVFKLFNLTIINGDNYRNKSDNNRLKDIKVTAPRGNIYDRNGKLLAGVKSTPAVQILKDEFNRLDNDQKIENIKKLVKYLSNDGASWDNDDYFIGYNYFVYKSNTDYFTEEKSPKEKVLDIIMKNNLVLDVLKLKIEKTQSSDFSYYVIKNVIRNLQFKGIYIPCDFFYVNSGEIAFSKGKKYDEYAKDKDLSKGIYEHVESLVKDDKSIIRKILDEPMARKLIYDMLKSKNLLENIKLEPIMDKNIYDYLIIKSKLNKQNSKVTLDSSTEDDFYNMVRKFTLDKVLKYVYVQKDKNKKIIPAKILIDKLKENKVDVNVDFSIVSDEDGQERVEFSYIKDEDSNVTALNHLIDLAEKNKILKDFILSEDVSLVCQVVNSNENKILKIAISKIKKNRKFEYIYEKERREIAQRYNLKSDFKVDKLYTALKKYYKIENLSDYETYNYLKIIRMMELQGDKAYLPINLTYGISDICTSNIKETFSNNHGISVSMEPVRYYPNGNVASHILGYIGKISQKDEIEKYNSKKGYSTDSLIGKTGIEESQEISLKGDDGFKRVMVDNRGNRTETILQKDAKPGKNVYLSIDLRLQKMAEESLKKTIDSVRTHSEYESKWGKYTPNETYPNAKSGATVVLDVKTGKVLALASYPSYDPNLFVTGISNSDWISLSPEDDKDFLAPKPLYNNAIQSISQPGSTFKLVTSLAALQKGLNPNEAINCQGYLNLGDTKFGCWIWNQYKGMHGPETLKTAIRDSCNYYFYALALGKDPNSGKKTGVKVEISDIVKTATELGLGSKTGIEINIPAESKGVVPDPNTKKSLTKILLKQKLEENIEKYIKKEKTKEDYDFNDIIEKIVSWADETPIPSRNDIINRLEEMNLDAQTILPETKASLADIIKFDYLNQANWSDSDSLNTVIGQGQNSYTTIQMARLMAMIANGGSQVKTSIIEKIISFDNKNTSFINNPESKKSDFNKVNLQDILDGMNLASKVPANHEIYKNLPIEIGNKTGTAEKSGINPVTKKPYDNYAWTVAFAPYKKPEIAIATVIIQGGTGVFCGPVIRDIVGQYVENLEQDKNAN